MLTVRSSQMGRQPLPTLQSKDGVRETAKTEDAHTPACAVLAKLTFVFPTTYKIQFFSRCTLGDPSERLVTSKSSKIRGASARMSSSRSAETLRISMSPGILPRTSRKCRIALTFTVNKILVSVELVKTARGRSDSAAVFFRTEFLARYVNFFLNRLVSVPRTIN